jgi:hypothetical protein
MDELKNQLGGITLEESFQERLDKLLLTQPATTDAVKLTAKQKNRTELHPHVKNILDCIQFLKGVELKNETEGKAIAKLLKEVGIQLNEDIILASPQSWIGHTKQERTIKF